MNIPSASIYRDLCPLNQGPTMVGKFIDYMLDFYGVNGVYPYAVTEKEIEKALVFDSSDSTGYRLTVTHLTANIVLKSLWNYEDTNR